MKTTTTTTTTTTTANYARGLPKAHLASRCLPRGSGLGLHVRVVAVVRMNAGGEKKNTSKEKHPTCRVS